MRNLASNCLAIVVALLVSSGSFAQTSVDFSTLFPSTVYLIVDAQLNGTTIHKQFTGSGVIISPDGYVLTAAHVLPDLVDSNTYVNVTVRGVVGTKYGLPIPMERTGFTNKDIDVTFLKLPNDIAVPLSVAKIRDTPTSPVSLDSFLTILGFPLDLGQSILHGRLTNLNGPKGTWVTDTKVQEGSSGGPVFDAFGQLIGIITGGFQDPANPSPLGLNLIVPIQAAHSVASGLAWQLGKASARIECNSSAITLTGDQATFPEAARSVLDRSKDPKEITGILASTYPWVILDNASINLSNGASVAPSTYRFCRLDFKNQSTITIGPKSVSILTNYLHVESGGISGVFKTPPAPDPAAATGPGAPGIPGKAGVSSGSVLLAVLVQSDGSLPIELDGAHGGNGGTGGAGASGADGAPGNSGSDSLFDCRRGPGDGERGWPGGAGGAGGPGGSGGDAGNLQIFKLASTIFPTGAVSYSGRGGKGGAGGLGGQGGNGGNGGPAGAQTTFCHGGNPGPKGPQGPNGPNGVQGLDGLDGTNKDSSVAEQDIINQF